MRLTHSGSHVSVVICTHNPNRWDHLVAAVASVEEQTAKPKEVIVVIDHSPQMSARARRELSRVRVIENAGAPGLSSARNTGVRESLGSIVAFLDDDAVAEPPWLARLMAAYEDDRVLGVGGSAVPLWESGRPRWFPEEFDWVVGCSYRGLPASRAHIRNSLGCNMSLRRDVLVDAGGFAETLGRGPSGQLGCEETELCIRAARRYPGGFFVYEPEARVRHTVPSSRSTLGYFLARCFAEGISKARVARLVGFHDALSAEREHTIRVLLRAVLKSLVGRDRAGFVRAAAIVGGVTAAVLGVVRGMLSRTTPRQPRLNTKSSAESVQVSTESRPPITVVVATRDRPSALKFCLESILAMTYGPFDVVVVDSASTWPQASRTIVSDFNDGRLSWIHSDRPGLAYAHNLALQRVSAPITAFTDDDVMVDSRWLEFIAGGFTAVSDVVCVTGLIQPLELETTPQIWFEKHVGVNKGDEPRIFDLDGHRPSDPLFPFTAGTMGSGANMAFGTRALGELGGFDAALGAGTAAMGGDDLAAFAQVILAGHRLVYEPRAVVYHRHPRTYSAARRQIFGYGAGLTAYLTKMVVDRPGLALSMARRLPAAVRYARNIRSGNGERTDYPAALVRFERLGMIAGPAAYLRSKVRMGEKS